MRRNLYDTIYQVITVIDQSNNKEIRPTKLMSKANLGGTYTNRYSSYKYIIETLKKQQIINITEKNKHKHITLTDKAYKYKKAYEEIKKLLR